VRKERGQGRRAFSQSSLGGPVQCLGRATIGGTSCSCVLVLLSLTATIHLPSPSAANRSPAKISALSIRVACGRRTISLISFLFLRFILRCFPRHTLSPSSPPIPSALNDLVWPRGTSLDATSHHADVEICRLWCIALSTDIDR
jgi:hypothetical protein